MNRQELISQIHHKKGYLCIGLDPDIDRLPSQFTKNAAGVADFCKEIVMATSDLCVAYKPNLAFFEALGPEGWTALKTIMDVVPDDVFTIADAKRGDIGNTSKMYAKTFFEHFDFDAVTVAPYMGVDSVSPFLEFEDKWVILLALTSNIGSQDFQLLTSDSKPLYQHVIEKSQAWGSPDNLMYVVGATHPDYFTKIRAIAPEHFLLVPGVGAQGGSVAEVAAHGKTSDVGLLINSSRSILYASKGLDFAEAARMETLSLIKQMNPL